MANTLEWLFEIEALNKKWKDMQAESDRRLGLLKKIVEESFLDVENQTWYWSCNQIEFDEMTKELGDD